jgi:hypothetical protein
MAESGTGSRLVATLWRLAWDGNQVSCVVYRSDHGFELSVESPTAVVITERFDLQPRALARAHALRDALKRRGWIEPSASSK